MNIMKRMGKKHKGRIQRFDRMKIVNAISKAYKEVDGKITDEAINEANRIALFVENTGYELMTVEKIQDIVVDQLMQGPRRDVARSYIEYRYRHSLLRNDYDRIMAMVKEKLNVTDIQNQNANVDEKSFGGRIGEASDSIQKEYALEFCMSEMSKENHLNNMIYIHDLSAYAVGSHNCLSIPFDPLLSGGFDTRQTDVRGSQSVSTAFQLLAVIFQLQSLQQFGGVSATHLDHTMVPYVRKSFWKYFVDGLKYIEDILVPPFEFDSKRTIESDDYKKYPRVYKFAMDKIKQETKQAVEGMYHNLNTLQSRSGNQLPFTSVNCGTDTSPEGRLITESILEGSIAGVGKHHKTSVFPCVIFQCKKGINRKKGEPNYDLFKKALKCTAKRLYPNYVNCDLKMQKEWVEYDRKCKREVISELSYYDTNALISELEYNPFLKDILMLDVVDNTLVVRDDELSIELMSTMGCRTQNAADINAKDSYEKNIKSVIKCGKLYDDFISAAQKDGRGNICPVTIIMPTLAAMCKEKNTSGSEELLVEDFMQLLDKKIGEAKDMLIERFNHICSQPMDAAKFMYENKTMSGYVEEEGIRSALRHGTLAIGQLGLAETLQLLIGCNHTTEKGMELAIRIESLFKKRAAEYKEEYHLNFGVYYTPKFCGRHISNDMYQFHIKRANVISW